MTWNFTLRNASISCSRERNTNKITPYTLHNTTIPKSVDIKYLGVTLDDQLTFRRHVKNVAAKANSSLGFVRRTVLTSSTSVKSTAYTQIVRPVLEYASGSWDSIGKTAAADLEAVQRRAARMVCGIRRTDRKTSTTGLLKGLNLPTLAERRKSARLKLFQHYHFDTTDKTIQTYLQPSLSTPKRRHQYQYMIPHSNMQHHQRSFFIKTAKEWNKLPDTSDFLRPPDRL